MKEWREVAYYVCDHCGEEWEGDGLPQDWKTVRESGTIIPSCKWPAQEQAGAELWAPIEGAVVIYGSVRHYCPECVMEGRADA